MNIYQYIENTISGRALARIQALVRERQMHPLRPAVGLPSVFTNARQAFTKVSRACIALPGAAKSIDAHTSPPAAEKPACDPRTGSLNSSKPCDY